jgi:hypothetical protein
VRGRRLDAFGGPSLIRGRPVVRDPTLCARQHARRALFLFGHRRSSMFVGIPVGRLFYPSKLMNRFLVTGCAGFIGSHVVEALLKEGHAVIGIDCLTDYYPRPIKLHNLVAFAHHSDFTFIEDDLTKAPPERDRWNGRWRLSLRSTSGRTR